MFSLLQTISNAHEDVVNKVCWVSSNSFISGGLDGFVRSWKTSSPEKNTALTPSHPLGIVSLDVDTQTNNALSNSIEGSSIHVYDLKENKLAFRIPCSPVECWAMKKTTLDSKILTGAFNGVIHIWNLQTKSKERSLDIHSKFIMDISVSSDDSLVSAAIEDGSIYLIDYITGNIVKKFTNHVKSVRKTVFSSDKKHLVSCSNDNLIQIHDIETGALLKTFLGHTDSVLSIHINNNNTLLASCSYDKQVKIWDLNSFECLQSFSNHTEEIWDVAFSPFDSQLVSVGADKNINIYSYK